MDDVQIKEMVRARYGGIAAARETSCCAPAASSCCGPEAASHDKARRMGYSEAELAAAPEGANLGLGCGNPQAIAAIQSGETVVDLGSGAGFDCFLAAQQVGTTGRVIGVDMTHEQQPLGRLLVASALHEHVEHDAGLVYGSPKPMLYPNNFEHEASGAGQLHPRALSEPDVILSHHPAPIVRPRP